jgi:hypothetical protein
LKSSDRAASVVERKDAALLSGVLRKKTGN